VDKAQTLALAAELRVAIGNLKRRFRDQASLGDLTWSQLCVIGRLDREGPATVTTLARLEGVRSQSMGATVSALETAGLVRGSQDPADGRQTILSLTDACQEWLKAGRVAKEDWLARVIQTKLAAAEQEQLAHAVKLLKRLVEGESSWH
jgi:DNA-binding MarR family transcriptional regulator